MNILRRISILACLAMILTGCHHTHSHETENHEEEEEDNPFAVHFHEEMQQKVDFSIVKVTKQEIGNIIETVAQVQPSQGDETVICAKADGVVSLKGKALTAGCAVGAGQAICTINASATANNNLSAQQQQAKTEYQRAKAEYERLKSLREEKLALESEVTNAKAAMDNALAELNALQKGFANGNQTVTSSTSGFLKQLLVRDGQFVNAGEQIAIITKSQTLQLKAEVPASYYSQLKEVFDANITINTNGEKSSFSVKELGGRMLSYGRQTSADSPLLPVIFEIKNVVDLVPGTFVNMYIKTQSAEEKVCVPVESIIEEMGNWFVYVQESAEHFEKRQVKVGASDGKNTEIIDGLKVGEKVVAKGAMLVKLQSATGNVDAEHGHSH